MCRRRRHVAASHWPAASDVAGQWPINRRSMAVNGGRPPVNERRTTSQRWSTTVNGGGPPVNHRRTTGQRWSTAGGQLGHGPGQVGSWAGSGRFCHVAPPEWATWLKVKLGLADILLKKGSNKALILVKIRRLKGRVRY
ncbi:hypothetical protein Tco_1134898 [Tanacetum coccineum]